MTTNHASQSPEQYSSSQGELVDIREQLIETARRAVNQAVPMTEAQVIPLVSRTVSSNATNPIVQHAMNPELYEQTMKTIDEIREAA